MHMYTCLDLDKHVHVQIHIMGDAYVYVQYITAHVHVRIYIFNAPEADSAYMYTCKDIYYGLSFTIWFY